MLRDKVFQMFILGSGNLDYAVTEGAGGVIFFSDDIKTEEQFKNLIDTLKQKAKTPLFFSIDQEGGRVERTINIRESRFLSPQFAFKNGADYLSKQTVKIAEELNHLGLNTNFAPCLDVNSNPNNPIIGERAFSNNPEDVCKGYDITSNIYSSHNIIPVIKHFPGHGDTSTDSHKELPIVNLTKEELENIHIQPFKYAISKGADAMMVAHIHCTYFDKDEIPTSLSKNCISYIRNTLHFDGVLISDDMFMKGVEKYSQLEACIKGIEAGLDMFIYRESSDKILALIEEVIEIAERDSELSNNINNSYNRIINLKRKYNLIK